MNKKRGSHTKKNDGNVIFDEGKVISQLEKQISQLAKQIARPKMFFHERNVTLCRWKSNFTPENGIFTAATVIVQMELEIAALHGKLKLNSLGMDRPRWKSKATPVSG